MKTIHVKKGEIVQRKGEVNSKVYKVEKGLLRSYAIDNKGKEHIFMFASEDWCIADSQAPELPCELFIDAIEDSTITIYEKETNKKRDASALFKMIFVLQQRVLLLMSASALERYEKFLETYPDIARRVPQKMIAAYLGITPEALSKLKRQKAKGIK